MHLPIVVLVTSLSLLTSAHRPTPRRTPVDLAARAAASPFAAALSLPQKQDSALLSPDVSKLDSASALHAAVLSNAPALHVAIESGKDLPRTSPASDPPTLAQRSSGKWDFAGSKIRGVNLGGFLVLEASLRPAIIRIPRTSASAPEKLTPYTFCSPGSTRLFLRLLETRVRRWNRMSPARIAHQLSSQPSWTSEPQSPLPVRLNGNSLSINRWTYGQILGRQEAARRLAVHWSTWITQVSSKDVREGTAATSLALASAG